MPSSDPWGPLALALRDYHQGDLGASVTVHLDDGSREELPAAYFFRGPDDFPPVEEAAVALCRGRVLDLGAGAGAHALALQARGLEVEALDSSAVAVEIMRQRGVRRARLGTLLDLPPQRFDTILLLMNGIGVVGTLDGLDRFLAYAHRFLEPEGQILFDSTDVRATGNRSEWVAINLRVRRGRYMGEIVFRFEYRSRIGPSFSWLFVDPDTLRDRAEKAGWHCHTVCTNEEGEFLTQLSEPAG